MPEDPTNDPLLARSKRAISRVQSSGLKIFYGSVPESPALVYWDVERGGEDEFIDCAVAVGANPIYVDWQVFSRDSIEGDATENGPSLAEYEKYVGLVGQFEIGFAANGLRHIFYESTDWFASFEEATASEEEVDGADGAPDEALLERLANTLANHPSFGRCKNQSARRFLLRRLAGGECDGLTDSAIWGIVDRAQATWELDVRPQEEERLRIKARELRSQGLTLNAIAQALSISRNRASELAES